MKKKEKNKFKAKLQAKHDRFEKNLNVLYDYFDLHYPGWDIKEDASYIKKRLHQTARKITDNIMKKKTKLLKKADFKIWPFYSDQIIIIQTSKLMVSVLIDMKEYALNGLAASALKLKFPHDCNKARMGESVSDFIQIGLKL